MKKIFAAISLFAVCLLSACSLFTLDVDGKVTITVNDISYSVDEYNVTTSGDVKTVYVLLEVNYYVKDFSATLKKDDTTISTSTFRHKEYALYYDYYDVTFTVASTENLDDYMISFGSLSIQLEDR